MIRRTTPTQRRGAVKTRSSADARGRKWGARKDRRRSLRSPAQRIAVIGGGAAVTAALLWQALFGFSSVRAQTLSRPEKQLYQVSEHPRFTIGTRPGFFRKAAEPVVRLVTIRGSGGKQSVPFQTTRSADAGSVTVAIDPPHDFQPGQYEATIIAEQNGALQTFTQDFAWGVLALNVPSATVQPWEDVPLHIAVLDDAGAMVCDANVTLTVTDPKGKKTVYRTGDRQLPVRPIGVNPECSRKERTERPDYEAHYRPEIPGRYTVRLIAKTASGVRELADGFTVATEQQFSIRRERFPTRLFPAAAYPVALRIQPQTDFHGSVVETVPASFVVTDVSESGVVSTENEKQLIRWNVDWRAGQTYQLGYTFDSSDTSPAFYALGPLQIGSQSEGRLWQLAVDGTEQFIAFTDGSVPTGWTCISCTSGDPFYQKFPRGNTTYGGTGGSDTHTHSMSLSGSTVNNQAHSETVLAGAITFAGYLDEHTSISSTSATGTSLPLYRNLKVIRYNNTGNPSTIPSGVIALFDAAPSGSWARYTNQDGYFIRGGNDSNICSDTCAATHTDTFSGTLDADGSGGSDPATSGVITTTVANLGHTHTFSGTTAANDHTPSSVRALLYQATATVPTPSGIIGLWSAAPPSGWTSVSGAGGDFNQKLVTGSATYSASNGAATHTPSDATASSVSGAANTTKPRGGGNVWVSLGSHTHTVTISFGSANNLPSYFDAIIAKKDAATSVSISGTIYTDEGTTAYNCSTNNLTVAIRVNGAGTYSGTCSASNGAYSIGSVSISAGDIVTVFLDGETEKAATVTRATNAAISGLDLYQNRLIVRDEDGSPIDNSLLGLYDGDDDADIPFTSNSSALSVSSGTELHVWTGKTFTPGGTVTTTASSSASGQGGDVHIAASSTLSMATNALSVGGDYNNAGTFSKSTGHTTTFTATATGFSITQGTGNFDSVTFNGSGGGWSPTAALAVDVDLTLTAGTLSGTQNVTVNGAVAGTAGSIALTGGTFTQRVGAAKNLGTTSGSTAWSFNSLTFSNSSGSGVTLTTQSGGTGSITVAGTLTVGNGSDSAGTTLDLANRTWIFTGTSPISVTSSPAATLTISTSTIRFATTSAFTVPLTYSYYNLELRPNGSGGPNYTLGSGASQTLTVTNNLTFGDGTNAVTIKADTYNPATNVGGSVTTNANVTYTKGTGTFTFNGTTAATYTDSTSSKQNLGTVSINKTDTAAPSTNNKLTLGSSMTVDTLTIDGTSGQADTLNLGTSGYTLKLANAGSSATVLTVNGTLTVGTSTIEYAATNSSDNVNINTLAYGSLRVSGAETYVLTGNLSGANAISGNVTIDNGATLDVVADSDYAMAVAGDWSNSGTFRPRSGVVTFNGSSSQTIDNGSSAFNDLVIANTGTAGTSNDDVIPSSDLTINDDLTVTSGQFKLSTNDPDVAVAGDVSIGASGIVTKGSGTVMFNGTTAATYTDSTSSKQNLGTVSINKTDTAAPSTNNKLTLGSSMTVDTLTIDGTSGQADTLNLGTSGYTLKLANAGSSATVLTVNGTLTTGVSTVEYAATNSAGSVSILPMTYSSLTVSGNETYTAASAMTVSADLTIQTGAFTAPSSTLTLGGDFDNDGAFNSNNGTVVFSATSGTKHIDADGTGTEVFANVSFTGSATWNMDSSVTVNGAFTQSGGTIYAPQTTLSVGGDFTRSGGTFAANGGTVLLSGDDQSIGGSTTFASLTKTVTTARTLTFAANTTQTITGTLTLQGASGAPLSLRSSVTGTQWLVDPQSTRSLDFLDVQDSKNVNATTIGTSGRTIVNSGNNTGWAFAPQPPANLSGTAVSSTAIYWTWSDASDDETGFKLLDEDGNTLQTIASANTTSVAETGLTRGTSYTRRVIAYNEHGDSAQSGAATATTNSSAPSIPSLKSPATDALLSTMTPSFTFGRSEDDDDGMGSYSLVFNAGTKAEHTIAVANLQDGETRTVTSADLSATATTETVTLTNNAVLAEGANTWDVIARDLAGNESTSAVRSFTVDITKPVLDSFSVDDAKTVADVATTTAQRPTIRLSVSDNHDLASVTIQFKRRAFLLGEEVGTVTERTDKLIADGKKASLADTPASPLPYGRYRAAITVTDAAGNASNAQRLFDIQTEEKAAQKPGGSAEEREKEIEEGKTPTKTPSDLTLPELEKRAKERREKEASNLVTFLQRFVPQGPLEQFNLRVGGFFTTLRTRMFAAGRTLKTKLAAVLGFGADELTQLRALTQRPACIGACGSQEQAVRESPLGTSLNRALPRVAANVIVAVQTVRDQTLGILTRARKNRSELAARNETLLATGLEPVARATHWAGVGVRVALDGIRGRYNEQVQITDVAISDLSPTSVVVSWKTNRVSRGKVNYGTSISYGEEAIVDGYTLDHSVTLQNLSPAQKYYFEVLATDLAGEDTFDAYYGFTTPLR